ncbi:MAG: glycosyltransferase [Candidatus Eisenbacteria bacterium]
MHSDKDTIRVGFLVSTLVTGGAERQLQHLILGLGPAFAPHLYCLREPGAIGEQLREHGIPMRCGLGPGRPPAPWNLVRLARHLRTDGIHILYCLDHTNAVVVGTLAAGLAGGLPVLVAVHTTGQWGRPSIPRPMRLVLRGITRFLAIAETQRRYLVETEGIPAAKITVIRNGIPPLDPDRLPDKSAARAALGIEAGEGPVVGILAMLRPEKAHENFLAAARLLLQRFPRAVFLIIGEGARRAALEELAASLGLARQTRFLGLRKDVPQILPALDLSVLSSHPRVETLPLSQMEAMSLGIPVVATRVGALHELIDEGVEGHLVAPQDPTALAEAMIDLLADPERKALAGRAARARILREFNVERVARETETVIRAVLGSADPCQTA